MQKSHTFKILKNEVDSCAKCLRLKKYREAVVQKKEYVSEVYWKKPLMGFGDPNAWLFILGLAPSAHGGNRTGRIFTGDDTSQFLMQLLFKAGFANQPFSTSIHDGLELQGIYMTSSVKCAPPKNLPTCKEITNCAHFWQKELANLPNVSSILVLGRIAFDSYLRYAKEQGETIEGVHFSHGAQFAFKNLPTLFVSLHPSPRNRNTGKITENMLLELLQCIKSEFEDGHQYKKNGI